MPQSHPCPVPHPAPRRETIALPCPDEFLSLFQHAADAEHVLAVPELLGLFMGPDQGTEDPGQGQDILPVMGQDILQQPHVPALKEEPVPLGDLRPRQVVPAGHMQHLFLEPFQAAVLQTGLPYPSGRMDQIHMPAGLRHAPAAHDEAGP